MPSLVTCASKALGRLKRKGQEADTITTDVDLTTEYARKALDHARRDAAFVW